MSYWEFVDLIGANNFPSKRFFRMSHIFLINAILEF